jgi:CCR4-NOT transcription complex subunit 1
VPNRLDAELQRAITEMMNGSQRNTDTTANEAVVRMQQMQNEQMAAAAQEAFNRRVDELIVELPQHLVFSQEYPIFTAPTLQRIVAHSVTRAVKDIVIPVVERSVTIAGISSRDLVQKDFGMEGDPNKMRQAAHMMVQNLAGNLALVTCKEALRTSMITNIRGMLVSNGFTEETMPDVPIQGIVNDNLDAACNVIKTAAMEKAVKDIDVNLAPQYAARRLHRDSRSSQPFWDGASFGVQISHGALPDPLRLRSGGLSAAQLRVYEDFSEHSRLVTQAAVNGDYANYGPDGFEIKRNATPAGGIPDPAPTPAILEPVQQVVPAQTTIEKFHEIVAEMEKYVNQAQAQGLTIASVTDEVRQAIRAVPLLASQTSNREQMTLVIAQRVVQLLYKTPVPLGREIYVLMLQGLCEVAPKVDAEVKQWLVYADDAVSFSLSSSSQS